MQPRIGSATVLLVASWIASGVVASSAYNALASSQSVSAKPTIPIIVTKAEFGILQVKSKKKVTFLPTNKIPLIEGNKYGWRIQLKDYQGEVTWREILQLPKHPDTWGDNRWRTLLDSITRH